MIRISILKGIDTDHPYWYKALIGTNPNSQEMKSGNTIIFLTQISTMTPTNPLNLEGFLNSFSKFGYFNLAPCYIDLNTTKPEFFNELGFVLKELSIRNAWEVGINDIDVTGIAATDKPLIPPNVTDAPVVEVLKVKRSREHNLSA